MNKKEKILIICVLIIIAAGAIMVGFKGFNVSLYLKEHDILEYVFDQKFEKSDVEEICKEVFGDKEFETRTVEVFDDSVYIISSSITDEEEEALLEKLSALYEDEEEITDESTEETSEETSIYDTLEEGTDYQVYHDSNVRLYDLVKPYIWPVVISAIIIIIGIMIRYKILKQKAILKTLKLIGECAVLLLVLVSLIAILRVPVSVWVMPALMFCILIYIIVKFEKEK